VTQYQLFDAQRLPLAGLPGPYDLIYGFYSVGFHWSLEFYLDELEGLMGERSLLVCTLNKNFHRFRRLEQFSTRVLACREVKKGGSNASASGLEAKGSFPRLGSRWMRFFRVRVPKGRLKLFKIGSRPISSRPCGPVKRIH